MPKYLFLRPDSRNWHVRFRYPDKVIEKSLGTSDIKRAEILALSHIAQHKARLLAVKPRLEATWRYEYHPGGLHDAPNGQRVAATETELKFYGPDGKLLRTTPNGGPALRIVNLEHRLGIPFVDERMIAFTEEAKAAAVPSGDDKLLDTYIEHRKITGYNEREAREVWALFKRLTDNKRLRNCDRNDGRKLVAYFVEKELALKTIEKKVAWLNAMTNLAIEEGKLKFNPFSSIIPTESNEEKKKRRRQPISDADVKAIKCNLSQLDEGDQLLVRLLASTGMRISEAFEIDHEEKERGIRYVVIGEKTSQSERRVPLPACVLPYLPTRITGPLLNRTKNADPSDAASKRLNRFLDDIGIVDKRKVIHSFRHRAQDRLRAFECPEDIRWAILGHEEETVADTYGTGFPVRVLKKWIDKIGF
jgi:integrase